MHHSAALPEASSTLKNKVVFYIQFYNNRVKCKEKIFCIIIELLLLKLLFQ